MGELRRTDVGTLAAGDFLPGVVVKGGKIRHPRGEWRVWGREGGNLGQCGGRMVGELCFF